MKLIICEKGSLARTVATAIGASKKVTIGAGTGYFSTPDGKYVVTWCRGHIMQLLDVPEYEFGVNTKEKISWKNIKLPYVPDFKYKVTPEKDKKEKYKLIKDLLSKCESVIHCGDPDREGQLIVDNVLESLGNKKPVERIWVGEQTPEGIRDGMRSLLDNNSKEMKWLKEEGLSRTYMDWLLGINLTIYLTNSSNSLLKVGRVMIPIVKYIYDRDMAIKNFKPEPYFQNSQEKPIKLISPIKHKTKEEAQKELEYLNSHTAVIEDVAVKDVKKYPQKLFKLSALQKTLASKYKIPLKKSMQIIQDLYEKGHITYPRTDSEYLGDKEKEAVKRTLKALNDSDLELKNSKRVFDSSKVVAHSALIPTYLTPKQGALSSDEQKVYDTILNRFKSNMCKEDCILTETKVTIKIGDKEFKISGNVVKQKGFLKYESMNFEQLDREYKKGETFKPNFVMEDKMTTPPKKVTVGELTDFLEHPFKKAEIDDLDVNDVEDIDDSEYYKELVKGVQIGTQATRTDIIDNTIQNQYISIDKQTYSIEPKGIFLINALDKLGISLYKEKSVEFSKLLAQVGNGEKTSNELVKDVENELKDIINKDVKLESYTQDNTLKNRKGETMEFNGEEVKVFDTKVGKVYKTESGFTLFETPYILGVKEKLSKAQVEKLLAGKTIEVKRTSKAGKEYSANVKMTVEDNKPKFEIDSFVNKDNKDSKKSKSKEM